MHNLTAKDKFDMSDMNPLTRFTGDVADISNMCVHKFYHMVQYRKQKEGFSFPHSKLGRFLGPYCNNEKEMTMNIMTVNGSIDPNCIIIPLTMIEMNTPDERRQRVVFDNLIRKKHGDSMIDCSFIPYKDDKEEPRLMPENDVKDTQFLLWMHS